MFPVPDFTGFYILMGVGLLFAGLIALLKLGLWFWVMTHVFHRPGPYRSEPEEAPKAPAPSSSIKTWLGIIATALGIVTTSVGLVKECKPESKSHETPSGPVYAPAVTPSVPTLGGFCCTYAGNCPLMMAAPVNTTCTCMDMLGNMAQGTVCQ